MNTPRMIMSLACRNTCWWWESRPSPIWPVIPHTLSSTSTTKQIHRWRNLRATKLIHMLCTFCNIVLCTGCFVFSNTDGDKKTDCWLLTYWLVPMKDIRHSIWHMNLSWGHALQCNRGSMGNSFGNSECDLARQGAWTDCLQFQCHRQEEWW